MSRGLQNGGHAEGPLPLSQRSRRPSSSTPVQARAASSHGISDGNIRQMPSNPTTDRALLSATTDRALNATTDKTLLNATTDKALLKALAAAAARDNVQALVIVDVDHFRSLRNVHGAGAAECLLRTLGKRLEAAAAARRGKFLRLGTAEFALVVPATECGPVILDWARSLATSFTVSYRQAKFPVTVSAGLTLYPGQGKSAAEALRCARQAVTQVKTLGVGGLTTCSVQQRRDARDRSELALELPGALNRGELVPFYQPVVSLRTNQLTGMEVLARWLHPRSGLLEPSAFIPFAEQQGLCCELTRSLLRQVRADAGSWPMHWTFAFNTSPNELPDVLAIIEESERVSRETIHGGRLELEVTETALMQDLELARRTVTIMQPYGVKVVLDDFGSGYANFNQLCQVPFSRLKIDKSLITTMIDDSRVQACAQAIIDLAHQLGMTATAEGVETAALANRLAGMGCDHAQGYYFGRPMPAAAMDALTVRMADAFGDLGWAA